MSCAVQLKKMTGDLQLNMKTTCCLETTFWHYVIVRLLFCSFGRDCKRPSSVQLNLLQMGFPHGLYDVVIDCLMLYMEYTLDIMAFSIHIEPFFN